MLGLLLAAAQVIEPRRVHLGEPGAPEWAEFAAPPAASRRLDVRFESRANAAEQTLLVRQRDVKLRWAVELNGRRIGELEGFEEAQVHALAAPPGALRDGPNVLSIVPPSGRDDVEVGEIVLDPRPRSEAIGGATLEVAVTEEGRAVPCRITVADAEGALAPIAVTPDPAFAVRTGVVYTRDGTARIGLRPGKYVVYASRGFEYSAPRASIEATSGQTTPVRLAIRREVPTPSLVACDVHLHTREYSGHGDATAAERMITLAGEGIELPIATEHNQHTSWAGDAARAGVTGFLTPVLGNEVTTAKGHFNIFPVRPGSPVPDAREEDWPKLTASIRRTTGAEVIVLNHPRDLHSGFRPFDAANFDAVTGRNRRGFEFEFNALEVVNSGALQSDLMLLYRDWFALLNYGVRVAAVGGSDSHDVARSVVGQARTYVECPDAAPGAIDVAAAARSIVQGRTYVSMGLLTRLAVEQADELTATATVLGPSWTRADRVELFMNGVRVREERLKPTDAVEKARVRWKLRRPSHDAWLAAVASGPGVREPFGATPKPYQPSSPAWEPRVIGSAGPIWIDGDGDGALTSPRKYAQALVERHGRDAKALVAALGSYDEATATQAADQCQDAGSEGYRRALESAPEHVRRGFAAAAADYRP
jgi:hypothetical protein